MDELENLLTDFISIEESLYQEGMFVFYGTLLQDGRKAFDTIGNRLNPLNLMPVLRKRGTQVELRIVPAPSVPKNKIWLNLVLFVATLITTIFAGSFLAGANPLEDPGLMISGIPFSLSLLLILGTHEFGHYFACKANGISATLPYFIPFPGSPIGTFGAVIRIKSPIQDKNRLVEVGASGPICGFIFAIVISIIGLKLSKVVPFQEGQISMGNSLIFWFLSKLFAQAPPPGYDIFLHPVAFAGWVGMFVTAANLLPLGQLDGGHISYAFVENKTKFIAYPIIAILAFLGIFWPGWLLLMVIVVLGIRLKHPPPLNNVSPLDLKHKIIGISALIVFVLAFIPVPFNVC